MKRTAHIILALVAAAALTVGGERPAHAGGASDVVKAKQTSLFVLLKQSTPDAGKKAAAIYDEMFDYAAFAEGSLGTEWAARSESERKQFSDYLKQLVRTSYERNLTKLLAFDVAYPGDTEAGGSIRVQTVARPRSAGSREERIEITLVLGQKDGKWSVQDIVTEGVSLVSSYRSQFTKIVKKDGFPALIKKMKDKLAKGDV